MKAKQLVLVTMFTLFVSSLSFSQNWFKKGEKGNGKLTTEQRTVKDFHSIKVSSSVDVTFTLGSQSVKVTTDENLQDNLKTVVVDGVLKIYAEKVKSSKKLLVEVQAPSLQAVSTTSSSSFTSSKVKADNNLAISSTSSSTLSIDETEATIVSISATSSSKSSVGVDATNLTISATSSASIDLDIDVQNITVSTTSSSDVTMRGESVNVTGKANSSSSIHAYGLTTQNATLSASSSADIELTATGSVQKSESSSGKIHIKKK